MRAAQIDDDGLVFNFVEVNAFTPHFIAPLDSEIGSVWNGTSFANPPPPPPPPLPDASPIITDSFNASLQRKAVKLQKQGNTFEAVQLLLQAQGVKS